MCNQGGGGGGYSKRKFLRGNLLFELDVCAMSA